MKEARKGWGRTWNQACSTPFPPLRGFFYLRVSYKGWQKNNCFFSGCFIVFRRWKLKLAHIPANFIEPSNIRETEWVWGGEGRDPAVSDFRKAEEKENRHKPEINPSANHFVSTTFFPANKGFFDWQSKLDVDVSAEGGGRGRGGRGKNPYPSFAQKRRKRKERNQQNRCHLFLLLLFPFLASKVTPVRPLPLCEKKKRRRRKLDQKTNSRSDPPRTFFSFFPSSVNEVTEVGKVERGKNSLSLFLAVNKIRTARFFSFR